MTKRFSVSGKLKRNGKIIKVILSFRNLPEQNQNGERREGRAARRERSIPDSHQDPSSSRTSRKESVLLFEPVECSSRYSKRGRFCVTFSRKRSMRHFGPSIGQTTGGKFFFSFLSLLTSSSSSSFLSFFFSASLDPLQALESVLASNSRLEYLGERGSVYISFPFVTSFDSLIQYRFSIASQRIFLEGRRIRNSLFSR